MLMCNIDNIEYCDSCGIYILHMYVYYAYIDVQTIQLYKLCYLVILYCKSNLKEIIKIKYNRIVMI